MSKNDRHGRNELLTEYIQYQAHLPHPDLRVEQGKAKSVDDEVGNIMRSNGEGKHLVIHIKMFTFLLPSSKLWPFWPFWPYQRSSDFSILQS